MSHPKIFWLASHLIALSGLCWAFTLPWTGLLGEVVTGFELLRYLAWAGLASDTPSLSACFFFVGLVSVWLYMGLHLVQAEAKRDFRRWLVLALGSGGLGMLGLLWWMLEGYGGWLRIFEGYWWAWAVLLLSAACNYVQARSS